MSAVPVHRGATTALYHLLTPANRMPSRLPWFDARVGGTILASPRRPPCAFTELLVSTEADARSDEVSAGEQNVLYVLRGGARVELASSVLELAGRGRYAYVGAQERFSLALDAGTELAWVRRPPTPSAAAAPAAFAGDAAAAPARRLAGRGTAIRHLLPSEDLGFDFSMNILSFEAGCGLDMVEIHDEDHGLLMLGGQGTYLLDRDRHAVRSGDFIYLAPYCPQHFVAGDEAAAYLLYKPTNRL